MLVLVGCGPAHVFHKDPERGCADVALAGPEDVAAAAGCTAIESLTIRTGMALDLTPLGRLETVRGAIAVGPTVGLTDLALPRLRAAGSIRVVANGNLGGIYLPQLESADAFEVEGNQALTTLSAPKLAAVKGRFAVTGNASLEVLNVAALTTVGDLMVANNPKLTLIETQLTGLAVVSPAEPPAPSSEP